MLKNNIFAFLTHILCMIIAFLIAALVQNNVTIGGILYIFIWGIYTFIGTKLKPQKSVINNLLSVSSIGILGLTLWVLSLGKRLTSVFWNIHFLFIIPIGGSFLILPKYYITKYISDNNLTFIFSLIPTILLWIGLQWKEWRAKHQKN